MLPINPQEIHEHPVASIFLLLLGAISFYIQDITLDGVYIWLFRIMSLVSLFMIILINRKRAWTEFLELIGRK